MDDDSQRGYHVTSEMISLVIPVHNEEAVLEAALRPLLDRAADFGDEVEILVVENGSRDGTWETLSALAAREPRIRALRSDRPDYGRALRLGLRACRGERILSDEIDVLDDGFHRAALQTLDAGADLVIGSKRHPDARDDRGLFRRLGTLVITGMLKAGCGLRASDTHGVKAWRREVARDIEGACRLEGDLFASEAVLRAERAGLRIVELPLSLRETRGTPIPLVRRVPRVLKEIRALRAALR